jgi:hypothetical protein
MLHRRNDDDRNENYFAYLEALLTEGKKPSDLIPFRRDLTTFADYFLRLLHQKEAILGLTLGDIVFIIVWHATDRDLDKTALELDYDSVNQVKYQLRKIRRKLGIIERSLPRRKQDSSE